jgi:hypothetical protein
VPAAAVGHDGAAQDGRDAQGGLHLHRTGVRQTEA